MVKKCPPKWTFLDFLQKSIHQFFLEMVQNEITYSPLTFREMAQPYNFGFALRIFLKFCTMNVDKSQVYGNYLNSFSEKIFVWVKWAILGLKMVHPHNFGSAQIFFLKFCKLKVTKRYMELISMVFLKKILIWGKCVIFAQKWHTIITLDPL